MSHDKKILKAYIAGPMRNIKYYNYEAFDDAYKFLRRLNIEPINPHKLDFEKSGFTPLSLPEDSDWSKIPSILNLKDIIRTDINSLLECDFVYALIGWRQSTGAVSEISTAHWANIPVIEEIRARRNTITSGLSEKNIQLDIDYVKSILEKLIN